jgi:type I restriction enzyme, S subunit
MKKGWETKSIGDVCEVVAGQSPEGKFYNAEGNGLPFYQGKKDFGAKFIEAPTVWTTQTTKVARDGDILMSVRAPVGPVNFATENICIGRGLAAIRSGPQIYRDFLYYQLLHLQPKIAGREGAVFASINKAEIEALPLAFAPLAEQQRIVGILDEAFAAIATAQANTEKNLRNARAVFESHLQSVFSQRGDGWVEKSVKEIAAPAKGSIRTGPFGSQLLHSEFVDVGIAVLGIDNAVANEFRWGKSRFITPEKYRQLERYTVHPGDVLITIMGTCGRCAIVPDDIPTAINTKHICCITLDRKQCLPGYLHIYFLHSSQSQGFLAKHAKGAIMAGLNMGLIQELPVMLPPTKVQAAIVEEASDLREETERLARLYERKLSELAALKKSLLHQAFTGQL